MRGKGGNRFSRDPIGGLSDEYKAMKGYCPKEKFRRQWGETKLECIRQGREKKNSGKSSTAPRAPTSHFRFCGVIKVVPPTQGPSLLLGASHSNAYKCRVAGAAFTL